MRDCLSSSVGHLQKFRQLGNVSGARCHTNAIFGESQFAFQVEDTSIISRLKWSFDFQLQLFGQFLVEAVDVGLGANDQKVVDVGRDV